MTTQIIPAKEDKNVEFVPFGAAESIKLNVKIVQSLIAVATRTGKLPDDRDCIRFMMLCRARHLNPFEGDAYLLGYDGKDGPQFSLITAHQVFLKRAEASPQFDGMESGVILQVEDEIVEREGDFMLKGEVLLGGWAKVFRKDRVKSCYRRLRLETFSSGRSRWEKDPAGMIVKCAEADALRSSFPSHLGGLYSAEESGMKQVEVSTPKFDKPPQSFLAAPKTAVPATVDAEFEPADAPEQPQTAYEPKSAPPEPEPDQTPLQKLQRLMESTGITESRLTRKLREIGFIGQSQEIPALSAAKLNKIIESYAPTAAEIREEDAANE